MQIKVKRIGNSGGRGDSEDRKAYMVDSGDDVIVLLFVSYGDYRDEGGKASIGKRLAVHEVRLR